MYNTFKRLKSILTFTSGQKESHLEIMAFKGLKTAIDQDEGVTYIYCGTYAVAIDTNDYLDCFYSSMQGSFYTTESFIKQYQEYRQRKPEIPSIERTLTWLKNYSELVFFGVGKSQTACIVNILNQASFALPYPYAPGNTILSDSSYSNDTLLVGDELRIYRHIQTKEKVLRRIPRTIQHGKTTYHKYYTTISSLQEFFPDMAMEQLYLSLASLYSKKHLILLDRVPTHILSNEVDIVAG